MMYEIAIEAGEDSARPAATDWRTRVIDGCRLAPWTLPDWAEGSYQILNERVTDERYPCFFGTQAERRGEMFYAFAAANDERHLIDSMSTFAKLAQQPLYERNNIAVFFEPDPEPLPHGEYGRLFWKRLQLLHDADTHPGADSPPGPSDAAWEFCYQGIEMFVVCACPSFQKRRSRNLGPGMVMLFQPRSVFIDKITHSAISHRARQEVRRRLESWDDVEPHPDLGMYGDPLNREWKQYFLPDENQPNGGVCPFASRFARRSK